jgi:hypothetical protein
MGAEHGSAAHARPDEGERFLLVGAELITFKLRGEASGQGGGLRQRPEGRTPYVRGHGTGDRQVIGDCRAAG